MTSDEHKSAAQALTAAIKSNTNGAYDEWVGSGGKLRDAAARAAFVQKHAGLSSTPSSADMQAIQAHVNSTLQNDVAAIKAKNPGEHVVGGMCLAED